MDDSTETRLGEAEPDPQPSSNEADVEENSPRAAPVDEEEGGMIGEGNSGEAAAEVTETDPRSSEPGGMIGEG